MGVWRCHREILQLLVMLVIQEMNKVGFLKWKSKKKELLYINESVFKKNMQFIVMINGGLILELNNLMAYQQVVHCFQKMEKFIKNKILNYY